MPSLLLIIAENRASMSSLFTKTGEAGIRTSENCAQQALIVREKRHTQKGLVPRSYRRDAILVKKALFT
jgi:hypothetical protein